ncbi:hypothetical protein NGB36_13420 [Streptomyces sp. RB6PN25]|uniref:Lipoprotein n=1 Tax=Streptomyces humicola TaxID=2953240 RepID=A0ABT1PYH9_9ACTN|nr:hypothetical protein [Streptomyces humicola]MCQ4081577.1 hypothetical protein [Streptomyces humicola]
MSLRLTPPRLRDVVALCCAAALTAAAGCASGAPAPSAAKPDAAIQAVLDQRAQAVLHHDETAFLATVDPEATVFRASQQQMFGNLAEVPLASWSYRLQRTGAFPLAPAADTTRQVAARVEFDYELRGYDSTPVSSTAYLTMTQRGGHWYLASQTDGEPAGRHTDVQLWDQGRVTVVSGAHSLVLGQGGRQALGPYTELADRAVPVVDRAWPGSWTGKAVVEVPGSEAGMAALLGAEPSAYQDIAAVTTAELHGRGSAPADRIIVNPQAFAELSPLGRQVVLTHELTHVATRTATTSTTPLWLSEGFADWVGYSTSGLPPAKAAEELAADVRAGRAPQQLPSSADFTTTSAGLPQAYEGAWLACRMVAEQWGSGALVSLYRAAGKEGTDAALRATLGIGLDAFTARWRAYVAKELR